MQINLSQITHLDLDILQQYSERTLSSHAINHNKKNFEQPDSEENI